MTRTRALLALPVLGVLWAQAPSPAFEVISIRPAAETGPRNEGNGKMAAGPLVSFSGPRATMRGQSVAGLIAFANNLSPLESISGTPRWAVDARYDIAAKAEGEGTLTPDQFRPMFQALLADRFKLKFHRETKEQPGYALVIGKNGPKLKPSAPDSQPMMRMISPAETVEIRFTKYTLEDLARQLSLQISQPVVDRTGLTGTYDFRVTWVFDRDQEREANNATMLAAVQDQTGLRLQAQKVALLNLVIDSVEKPPEN